MPVNAGYGEREATQSVIGLPFVAVRISLQTVLEVEQDCNFQLAGRMLLYSLMQA
jgi:hypothetical protein